MHRVEDRVEEWRRAVTERHRYVFVIHSDEEARTLETFASERNRLVEVVPVKTSLEGETDIKGSWLVFEESG